MSSFNPGDYGPVGRSRGRSTTAAGVGGGSLPNVPALVQDTYVNDSGGSLAVGDVVIIGGTGDNRVTTTMTDRYEGTVGIVQTPAAAGAQVRVATQGVVSLVNVPSAVAAYEFIETHTVAGQAVGNATRRSGSFGQFLSSTDEPAAVLWGQTDPSGGGALTVEESGDSPISPVDHIVFAASDDASVDVVDDGGGQVTVTIGATVGVGGGDLTLITETVLGSAQADITITGIPATYRDLIVVVSARSSTANAKVITLRCGAGSIDSGSNYGHYRAFAGTLGSGTTSSASATGIDVGAIPGSGTTAGWFGKTRVEILDYASTRSKVAIAQSFEHGSDGTLHSFGGGHWNNVSGALDQISIFAASGNLDTGSRVTVYGRG